MNKSMFHGVVENAFKATVCFHMCFLCSFVFVLQCPP